VLFLASQLSANKKISFENKNSKIFNEFVTIDFKTEHVTLRYKKALELLDFKNNNLNYEVKIDENALALAQRYISELKKDGKSVIILNSFAGGKLRNFTYEKSTEIVTEILNNFSAVVVSVANKGDQQILAHWMNKAQIANWVVNSDFDSIDMNVALASLADIIVTPDTAWVHIASALNKKLVAVYRADKPTDIELNSVIWAPRSEFFEVVFANPEVVTNEDINEFKTSDVIDAIKKIAANK
jgi:ADP-heptose:LPS heptosyltransferase